MNQLAVSHLYKSYGREKYTLKNINLHINQGEIIGLVGESGSGKSSIAKVIMQLEYYQKGIVEFNDDEVNSDNRKKFYQECQLLFQNAAASFNPYWTVKKILQEALPVRERSYIIESSLKMVGLPNDILTLKPVQLSGGEKQRINLLRALLKAPSLLVCDEIISNLDRITQRQVVDLLIDINKKNNMSILFISHDLKAINYLCDRVYVLADGEIIEESTKQGKTFNFEHPYSKKLFDAIV